MDEDRIKYLKMGLRIIGFNFSDKVLETILQVDKMVCEKSSKVTLLDLTIIEIDMKNKYTEKEEENV